MSYYFKRDRFILCILDKLMKTQCGCFWKLICKVQYFYITFKRGTFVIFLLLWISFNVKEIKGLIDINNSKQLPFYFLSSAFYFSRSVVALLSISCTNQFITNNMKPQ